MDALHVQTVEKEELKLSFNQRAIIVSVKKNFITSRKQEVNQYGRAIRTYTPVRAGVERLPDIYVYMYI